MKKLVLAAALSLAVPAFARAEDQTDLMKRMGFSAKEIAATQERHEATAKLLDATGSPKNQESAAGSSAAQAQAILDLRSIRQIRYQAIQTSKAAEKEAQDAAACAEEAENKARSARDYVTRAVGNQGISPAVFSQALVGRDQFENAANAARQKANQKAREAAEISEKSERIIARANAQEAELRSKGIDE
jgi:hypothetical protein